MGLFSMFAGCLPTRRQNRAKRFDADPLSPRRLECRRLLDASAAGLVLAPLVDTSEYVQAGESINSGLDTFDDSPSGGIDEANTPPTNLQFAPVGMIDENGFAQLELTFDDPGSQDTHTVEIDWGDGNTTTIELEGGERFVGTSHQYLDDDPSVTSSDEYTITVKVTDDDSGMTSDATTVLVKNVAPTNLQFAPVGMIDENGFAQLELTFDDPGSQDTHTVEIDWGDGNTTTIELEGGERFVGTSHQYLDDDPSVTSSDEYTITVKVTDDDSGMTSDATTVLVKNVAPTNLQFAPVGMIDENGFAQLELTFDDPGSQDTHTVEIDWGDGNTTTIELEGGERFVGTSHQYLDDDPSVTSSDEYTITVKVTDDDSGMTSDATTVLVKNVAPTNLQFAPVGMIDENGFAQLELTFDDPGSQDTHTVEIDWGDGNTTTIELEGGERFVGTSHQYLDDDPSVTSSDEYTITVKVTDDDSGMTSDATTVLVKNVAPTNLQFAPVGMIDENGFAQLELTFDDPGSQDTHTVEIDWGDGNTTTIELEGGERFVGTSHQYLDDDPSVTSSDEYTITVKVTDDDSGMTSDATTVLVKNVAPTIDTLEVTPSSIDEGNSVTLTGTYSDIGSLDSHTAIVRWGDGTVQSLPLDDTGTFEITHFYADNDTVNPDDAAVDNLYTIEVTIEDDDLGQTTQSIDVTVFDVSPNLDPILSVTNVNTKGQTELVIRFDDPGADTLTIYVDWGDIRDPEDPSKPALEPYVIELSGFEGPGQFTQTLTHTYSGPPNPLSPASDIEINVFVTDDDFGVDGIVEDGMSQIRTVAISNPGIGRDKPRIDTTPEVPRLIFPRESQNGRFIGSIANFEESSRLGDMRSTAGEPSITTDQFLELRIIDASENLAEGYRLKDEVLSNLPKLFRSLPDNHYAIYLVRAETQTRRLVLEFYIRNGKAIDPGDDSEGTRDRPPTDETHRLPDDTPAVEIDQQDAAENGKPVPADTPADDTTSGLGPLRPDGQTPILSNSRHLPLGLAPGVAGLVATASFRSWAEQVDRAVAKASPNKWKRLRLRYPHKRKNR